MNSKHQTIDLVLATLANDDIIYETESVKWSEAVKKEKHLIETLQPLYNYSLTSREKRCHHCGLIFTYMKALTNHEAICEQ
jgi:hypothetical protein